MARLMKLAGIPVLALGLALMTGGNEADAGGFSIQIGNYGYGNYHYGNRGVYHSYRPSYGRSIYYGRSSFAPSYNYYRSYGGYHHPIRPHYDYHPPSLVPHGNHLDYVPGHYDFHHNGHIHH